MKMKLKKWLLVMVIGFLIVGVLVVCGVGEGMFNGGVSSDDKDKKVLVMGILVDYLLFEYIDMVKGDSEVIGFDVDLVKIIGKKLGYDV